MLLPDSVVSSSDRVLDVAEQGVDPVELRIRHAGTTASGDVALVDAGDRVKGPETVETIADNVASGRNGLLAIATHLGQGKAAHTAKLNPHRVALAIGWYRSDKGEFMLGTTTSFSRPFAAQIGVINLDAAAEPLSLVAVVHDLQHLVFGLPGRVISDTEIPRQLQCRETALTLGQQINGQEPGGQRQVSRMKDSAGGQ